MAYGGFPVGYQPAYPQQYGAGQQAYSATVSGAYQGGQQLLTPPTIHAEIIQVAGRDEAYNWPVGPGQSQMMMARDDSAIFIKTVYANGQVSFIAYPQEQPKVDPQPDYVTRAELEERLAEITKPKAKAKKEVADEPGI